MNEIILRGHHIYDLLWYIKDRDKGISHHSILERYMIGDRPLGLGHTADESFERHTTGLFCAIYGGKNIRLMVGLDDICLGPLRENPGVWCALYSYENCLSNILLAKDKGYLDLLGFKEYDIINTKELIELIREKDIEIFKLGFELVS